MGQRQAKAFRSQTLDDNQEKRPKQSRVKRTLSAITVGTRSGRKRSEPGVAVRGLRVLPPQVTEEQTEVIKTTFVVIKQAAEQAGVIMFMRLFETHPEVQDRFLPFKGLSKEDLKHSTQLRHHGLSVLGFVEKCVARIDQPEKTVALCRELGLRHIHYGTPVDYLELIGPQFIYAIKPAFEDSWSPEVEEAWLAFFAQTIYYMRQHMVPADQLAKQPSTSRKRSV